MLLAKTKVDEQVAHANAIVAIVDYLDDYKVDLPMYINQIQKYSVHDNINL